ncbi:MAG: hypothetical protein HY231_23755 [Acidobacteria bacterium]|nr:hypothetical protein [Acidobacteriota bacterium]
MSILFWLLICIGWLCTGEVLALFTALLLPQSFTDKQGRFAWYWVSARVLLWPLVLLFGFFYALSLPVRLVLERVRFAPNVANSNLKEVG